MIASMWGNGICAGDQCQLFANPLHMRCFVHGMERRAESPDAYLT